MLQEIYFTEWEKKVVLVPGNNICKDDTENMRNKKYFGNWFLFVFITIKICIVR